MEHTNQRIMTSKERYKKWYDANPEKARAEKAANMRRYRAEQPDKHREQSRQAKKRLRDALDAIYGTICVSCGFSDRRAITLDHVLNNGSDERERLGERGVYRRALLPEFRHEYQALCMNCQFIKRHEAGRQNLWLRSHGASLAGLDETVEK